MHDGGHLVKFPELAKGINWDLILMFAATLPVSTAMSSGDTGIIATVMTGLTPIFSTMSPVVFMIVALLIFGLVTQVAHNLIIMMVFTPVLANLCVVYGIPPLFFAFALAVVLQCAFMTPAASAPAALIYSNTEWIEPKQAYFCSFLFVGLAFAVIFCVMVPVGLLLF